MLYSTLLAFVSTALLANAGTTPAASSLQRRTTNQGPLIGCYVGGVGGCPCPTDNNGDSGVLINVFPGYQCAYPNGACSWNDKVFFQIFGRERCN